MHRRFRCSGTATCTATRLVAASVPSACGRAKQSASPECGDDYTDSCVDYTDSRVDYTDSRVDYTDSRAVGRFLANCNFFIEHWIPREFGPALAEDRPNAARCSCSCSVLAFVATARRFRGASVCVKHGFRSSEPRHSIDIGTRRAEHNQLVRIAMGTDAMVSGASAGRHRDGDF